MARGLDVGDRVLCRLYNTPEGKFYGDTFVGRIVAVNHDYRSNRDKPFLVARSDKLPDIWLNRKEIKRRIE